MCGQHGRWDPGIAGGKPMMCETNESPELMSVCHVSFSTDAIIPGQCQLYIYWSRTPSSRNVQVFWNLLSTSWNIKVS